MSVNGRRKLSRSSIENLRRRPPVVWRFGNKKPIDSDYQLNHPTYAEEIDAGKNVLIADKRNNRVIVVDKLTKEIDQKYGEGDGLDLGEPHQASIHEDGDILTGGYKSGGIKKIDRHTHNIVWSYSMDVTVNSVIPWSSDLIAIGTVDGEVLWVRLSDKSVEKKWTEGVTVKGITKLNREQSHGDTGEPTVLVADSGNNAVKEIKYSDLSKVWDYYPNASVGRPVGFPHWAVRMGGMSNAYKGEVTFVSNNEAETVLAINQKKDLMWQLGGTFGRNRPHMGNINLVCPHGISITRKGNLLIADSHGHQVLEVDLSRPPQPRFPKDVESFFHDGRDTVDDYSIDAGWTSDPVNVSYYRDKTIYFYSDTAGTLTIQIKNLAGDVYDYDTVSVSANELEPYHFTHGAWKMRITFDTAATITAWYHLQN